MAILLGLWKAVRLLLLSALGLAAGLVFAVVVFLAQPSWFVNSRIAAGAIKRFGASYRPEWSSLELEIASPGFLTKRVLVSAEDFCVDAKDGSAKGCLPRVGLDATVRLGWKPIVSVTRLEQLVLYVDGLALDSRKAPKKAAAAEKKSGGFVGLPELVPAPLRRTLVRTIDVRVSDFSSRTSSGTLRADLEAAFSSFSTDPLRAHAYVVRVGTSAAQVARYDVVATLDSDLPRKGKLTFLQAGARVRGSAVLDATARVQQGSGEELVAKVDATLKAAARTLYAKLEGRQTPTLYSVRGAVGAADPAGPIRRAELKRCKLDAPLKEDTNRPKSVDLTCALELEPAPFGAQPGTRAKALAGKISLKSDFSGRDAFDAKLDASVGPALDYYNFFAKLTAEFSGRTGRLPESLKAEHKLDAGFRIDKFEDLVTYLKGTAYAIPAPLHALQGPMSFSVRSSGPTRGPDHGFDYRVRSRLEHGRQKVIADATGRLLIKDMFSPKRVPTSRTEVVLKDVAIQLPYLSIGAFPTVKVDTRIKTGDPKRDQAAEARRRAIRERPEVPGRHEVRVVTEKPVLLFTNLAKDPIPIALDLGAKPAGLEGAIRIEPFRVEIFKQQARVEHVKLTPHPGSAAMDLDGKIVYRKHDVRIDVLLLGSTQKPQVDFQSTPPMSRDEIVAVLFYGKRPGELDSEQQATVGNASAGMATGAFGLLSLYLLAATPIDYVGYDPATQTYQARFELPGGATLSVGSNLEESRTLSLRKRIAKNLELETGVRRGSGDRNVITTFLQWFRRY